MASTEVALGKDAEAHFTVFDIDGYTPLSGQAGSIVTDVFFDGTDSPITATVSEVGTTGTYFITMTPDAVGSWSIKIDVPATFDVFSCNFVVETEDEESITACLTDIKADLAAILGELITATGDDC